MLRLTKSENIEIKICDISGREIGNPFGEFNKAGITTLKLSTEETIETQLMLLIQRWNHYPELWNLQKMESN